MDIFLNWTVPSIREANGLQKWPHTFFDCEVLATLKLKQLGQLFMKPGDYEDISASRILNSVQGMVLLNT